MIKKIFTVVFLIANTILLNAQADYPVPDFSNKPMLYDSESNELTPLERQNAELTTKAKIGGSAGYYFYEDSISDVRANSDGKVEFIIKPINPEIELEQQIALWEYTVNENKNRRELLMYTSSVVSAMKTVGEPLSFEYKKLNDELFLISLSGVKPGEYGFGTGTVTYLFGID